MTAVSETLFVPEYRHCEKHGDYQVNQDDGGVVRYNLHCPKCSQEMHLGRLLDRAAIPARFRDKTFDNYQTDTDDERKAYVSAKEYADSFKTILQCGRCLIFVGPPGTGKTHLACAIANQIMKSGHSALFMSVGDLIRKVRASWKRDNRETEVDVINQFGMVDLLILDEVGVQHGSDSEQTSVFEVINRRYQDVKPTIIISNLPLISEDGKSIKGYLGERSYDRLRENRGKLVQFVGESKRGQSND